MILPLPTFCENEFILAKYPAPLWILPQYRAEGETERREIRRWGDKGVRG